MLDTITQHPNEILRYEIDYSRWLNTSASELVSAVSASVSPVTDPALTVTAGVVAGSTGIFFVVTGGDADTDYEVTLLVDTTELNQRDRECIQVLIRENC